jgi:predicted Zn-dependent protease
MDVHLQARLTEANKLIFIKKYNAALAVLDQALKEPMGKNELLVHLRKIELLSGLPDAEKGLLSYRESLHEEGVSPTTRGICQALCDLWAEQVPLEHSIATLQILRDKLPTAAMLPFALGLCYEMDDDTTAALAAYHQSLALDAEWYPAFFHLSQLYFQLEDKVQGEHFFHLSERYAPYYLHGNFTTHRQLCEEFLAQHSYAEAETSITTLSEWWAQQKQRCPHEVKIYEFLIRARIARLAHKTSLQQQHFQAALALAHQLVDSHERDSNALFFVLNIFDDYSNDPAFFALLKKIIHSAGNDPTLLKAIASKLFVHGKISDAVTLFDEAYQRFPDNEEVRFCRLLANVKSKGVAVDKYFAAKEHYSSLENSEVSKSELLVQLHGLLALYDGDPDVHLAIANLHQYLGNNERAQEHYALMLQSDPYARKTKLNYAASLVPTREFSRIAALLEELHFCGQSEQERYLEQKWLLTLCYFEQQRYQQALPLLGILVDIDPWNARYLTYLLMTHSSLNLSSHSQSDEDTLRSLAGGASTDANWQNFRKITAYFVANGQNEIAYLRNKLDFLYHYQDEEVFTRLLSAALNFNSTTATSDLLKLLNSNFDSPAITLGLARLAQEQWQLETASMWYEQLLRRDFISQTLKQRAYSELADCYLWRNFNLEKAQQFIVLAREAAPAAGEKLPLIEAHLYLRRGLLHEAKFLLESLPRTAENFLFVGTLLVAKRSCGKSKSGVEAPDQASGYGFA